MCQREKARKTLKKRRRVSALRQGAPRFSHEKAGLWRLVTEKLCA
jgi:hypothetical protein